MAKVIEAMDGRCTKEDCFLIQFIVITRKGLDTSAFPLNDLSAGRMDLKARAICSSLYISNGIRRNSSITLLNDVIGNLIYINGNEVKTLHTNERDICCQLKKLMNLTLLDEDVKGSKIKGKTASASVKSHNDFVREGTGAGRVERVAGGKSEDDPFPGMYFFAGGKSLSGQLSCAFPSNVTGGEEPLLLYLDQHGTPIHHFLSGDGVAATIRRAGVRIILGDDEGFTEDDGKVISSNGGISISLGPLSLLGSQCIVIFHNAIDTMVHACEVGIGGTQRRGYQPYRFM